MYQSSVKVNEKPSQLPINDIVAQRRSTYNFLTHQIGEKK